MSELLYTVFTKIDPAYEEEFNQWQAKEHCPYLLGLPGYYSVTRYASLDEPFVYANFWHIAGKQYFDNPERKKRADTPWGLRLSPFRHRRIDFYEQDQVIGTDAPPNAELDNRTAFLVVERYSDKSDMRYGLTEKYRTLLSKVKKREEVIDARIYHAFEGMGQDENDVFYYLNCTRQQMNTKFIPWLISELGAENAWVTRTRYKCMSRWDARLEYPVSFEPASEEQRDGKVENQKYQMIVYSNYVEGREEEFIKWYAGQHIHDMLNISAFKGCRWYRLSEKQQTGTVADKKYQYVMIWDIETDDLNKVWAEIVEARANGAITYSPAFDRATYCTVCEPVTGYISAEEIQGLSAEEVLALAKPE